MSSLGPPLKKRDGRNFHAALRSKNRPGAAFAWPDRSRGLGSSLFAQGSEHSGQRRAAMRKNGPVNKICSSGPVCKGLYFARKLRMALSMLPCMVSPTLRASARWSSRIPCRIQSSITPTKLYL